MRGSVARAVAGTDLYDLVAGSLCDCICCAVHCCCFVVALGVACCAVLVHCCFAVALRVSDIALDVAFVIAVQCTVF